MMTPSIIEGFKKSDALQMCRELRWCSTDESLYGARQCKELVVKSVVVSHVKTSDGLTKATMATQSSAPNCLDVARLQQRAKTNTGVIAQKTIQALRSYSPLSETELAVVDITLRLTGSIPR